MSNHLGDTNKMVDTPRTNARVKQMIDNDQGPEGLEYWARDLERELNAANTEIEEKRKDVVWLATEKAKLENYVTELENRLRALWDKYDGDRKHYMDRIKRLEEAGDALYENSDPTRWDSLQAANRKLDEQEAWRKAKEAKP